MIEQMKKAISKAKNPRGDRLELSDEDEQILSEVWDNIAKEETAKAKKKSASKKPSSKS